MEAEKIIEALSDDFNAASRYLKKQLFEGVIALHNELFAIPGEEKRFQEWLKARHSKEAVA